MRRIVLLLLSSVLLLPLSGGFLHAQRNRTDNEYNLRKAYEVLQEDEEDSYSKALDLLNKQLRLTPDNVEALELRMRVYYNLREPGNALADVNRAIKINKPKDSKIDNCYLYWWQGIIYGYLENEEKNVESMKTAYTWAKKEKSYYKTPISRAYGRSLYYSEDLAGAEAIFKELLLEDETDVAAMDGLANVMIDRGQYTDAEKMLLEAKRIRGDYPDIYESFTILYDKMGVTDKAIDSAIQYIDKDPDANWRWLTYVSRDNPNYAAANIKVKIKTSDKPLVWRSLLYEVYSAAGNDELALKEAIQLEKEMGSTRDILSMKARHYRNLGMPQMAVLELDKVIEEEGDWRSYCDRGSSYRLCGNFEKAIEDFTAAIEEDPRYAFPYYCRGWCKELSGHETEALEDYNLGIDIDKDYPYLFLQRGLLLMKMGQTEQAKSDLETAIAKDTIPSKGNATHYALQALGRNDEALDWMNKTLEAIPDDEGIRYDQACLYARMGRTDDALDALETAFEKGYRDFTHMEYDGDMDSLRDLPRYKEMVARYKAIHEQFVRKFDAQPTAYRSTTTSEIAFTRQGGGTFEIPCQINGLPLHMIFDTGASDVTISSVEANFMLKNRYLSQKDIKGTKYYQVASGELTPGAVITLREVKIGDMTLRDVDASVVNNQRAPLLLGQSALERFGTITIDNENNKLIIKH